MSSESSSSTLTSVQYGGVELKMEGVEKLPRFSPNAARVLAVAQEEAMRRHHSNLGTEHVLWSLMQSRGGEDPRVIPWIDKIMTKERQDEQKQHWREEMVARIEARSSFASQQDDSCEGPGVTNALSEVFDVVNQLSSAPVQDGSIIVADGIVATEFLVAAIMLHGVNVASEVIARASRGRINSWNILDAINVDPTTIHVDRGVVLKVQKFSQPANAAPVLGPKPFVVGAVSLPDPLKMPDPPTDDSNWLLPGHLIIGAKPSVSEAKALQKAGVTTFVSLIGEQTFEGYQRSYPKGIKKANFVYFPVRDFDVPNSEELVGLIFFLQQRLVSGECLYVHCRGGHGRTGTVVIPLISGLFDLDNAEATKFVLDSTLHTRPSDRSYAQKGWAVHMPETHEQVEVTQNANAHVRHISARKR